MKSALSSRFRVGGSVALLGLSACSTGSERSSVLREAIDADAPVVIRQVYGGGSNSGAPFTHDFVELFNRSSAPVSLAGWSVQYASATGTGNFGANTGQLSELPDVTLEPGQSFLIQESGGAVGSPLPAADLVDATPINLSGTAGKVALVRSAMTLGCNGSTGQPCSDAALALIVDLVGYGNANFSEISGAPTLSNTTSASRDGGGCTDTNDNSADFSAGPVSPHNSLSPLSPCGGGGGTGGAGGGGSGTGGAPGGSGGTAGSGGTPEPGSVRIHDIQGAAHRSPLAGSSVVNVPGIVTQVRSNGFYFEDPSPDADDATSEGLFVFSSSAPAVAVGDSVLVSGSVSEFRPGCSPSCSPSTSGFANLTTTELVSPSVIVLSSANPLPAATLVGPGGRVAPASVIDDDAAIDVESASAVFAPTEDGIDFYESLEGMRVELRDVVAVGPTNSFGELPVLPGGGAGASLRSERGGIVIRADDFNPERIFLDSDAMPALDVGDSFPGSVFAVVDYSFANFKFVPDVLPEPVRAGLSREVTTLAARAVNELDVASFNVENLDPFDPPAKFATLAGLVVTNLGSPDLIALEEVQDDNGPTNDGTVSADTTLARLTEAISAAGGPSYSYRSIDPVDGQDGGEPGGNIRVAFLYRTDRGLTFVDRPGASATTANAVVSVGGAPQLTFSPGRIAPSSAAFSNSRKPLAAELRFNGQTVFAVANHWNSKGGDQPLFGRFQPPARSSEVQRTQQAAVVRDFVAQISAIDAQARVLVLGDLNDFEFSPAVSTLETAGLTALVETLPESQRYSYVFEGNSQVLDQVMGSSSLLSSLRGFDVVHVNAEFAVQASDHDPAVARFAVGSLPTKSLIPILECVERVGPLQWVARYGYDNPNGLGVTRAVGSRNQFIPSPANRGQPTTFAPGRNRDAVRVPFHGGLVVWNLDGRLEPASALLGPLCR